MQPRTHEELYDEIYAMRMETRLACQQLRNELNNVADDMVMMRSNVRDLMGLRNQGAGFLAAIALVGALLVMGLKTWVQNIIKGVS